MHDRDTQLTADIMRRVRTIHALRAVANSAAIKGVVFIVLCAVTAVFVSIPHVIQNMSHLSGIAQDASFLESAFTHTAFKVEAILILTLIFCAWFVSDVVRNVRQGKLIVA